MENLVNSLSSRNNVPLLTDTKSEQVQRQALPATLLLAALIFTTWIYLDIFHWLHERWQTKDYSHGYFVPLFSLYILWTRRDQLSQRQFQSNDAATRWARGIGIAILLAGLSLRLLGIYTRILTLEGLSLVPFLLGTLILVYGTAIGRWAAPAILFLAFMVPLPAVLANKMSGNLQAIATVASTFSLQTIGVPAVADGNVISLPRGEIGVAEACSGLRMLYAFFALTVGACLVINRSWWEKLLIACAAVPIAILVNCIRIIATGIAFEFAGPEIAERIFHDLAGWLMMPLGFGFLLFGLWLFDRMIITDNPSVRGT
jgi:exosortase